MRKFIVLLLALIVISPLAYSQNSALSVQFYLYSNKTVEIDDVSLINASPDKITTDGDIYTVSLKGEDGEVLAVRSFNPSFHVFTHGEVYTTNSTYKSYKFDHSSDMSELVIRKGNKSLKSIVIPEYACDQDGRCPDYCAGKGMDPDCGCGNGECEEGRGENFDSCPEDCASGVRDGKCDGLRDGKCDPDCDEQNDPDCERSFLKNYWPYLLGGIAVLVLIMIIFTSVRFED